MTASRDAATPMVERARAFLFRNFFSSLSGLTFGAWRRLLGENSFGIEPRYWPRALFIAGASLGNSLFSRWEERRYGPAIDAEPIPPILFVLGHWRSGTTLLQNLLAADPRFASINLYQAMYPSTFLTTEGHGRLFGLFLPMSRGVDAMPIGFELAAEDEFALAGLTGMSPYLGWSFPQRELHYEKYLTFRDVAPREIESWKRAFRRLAAKLSLRYGRRFLVLKSPPHTARVRLLLEAFPEAKFVHVHRRPDEVFSSTVRLVEQGTAGLRLQSPDRAQIEEGVLRRYRVMHDAYLDDLAIVPPGRLHELRFADLERDPTAELRRLYESLALPDFQEAQLEVERVVQSTASYQKNVHPILDELRLCRVRQAAERFLQRYEYPVCDGGGGKRS